MKTLGLYCIVTALAMAGARYYHQAHHASFDERFSQWGVHRDKTMPPQIIKPRLRTQVAEADRLL